MAAVLLRRLCPLHLMKSIQLFPLMFRLPSRVSYWWLFKWKHSLAWGKKFVTLLAELARNLIGVYANTVIMFQKKVSTFVCFSGILEDESQVLDYRLFCSKWEWLWIFNLKPNITDIILTSDLQNHFSREIIFLVYFIIVSFTFPLIYSFESILT